MTRSFIRSLILFLLICFNIVPTFAREQERKQALELHQAIFDGDIEKVKSLLSSGVDINSLNRENWTPLHTAINQKNIEIVQLLLDRDANLNLISSQGETPLHFAVKSGQKDIVELLIAKGADVNIVSMMGENALSLSRKGGYTEITELLLKHGAKEPSEVMNEERLNDRRGLPERGDVPLEGETENRPGPGNMQSQRPNETDLLADPNEIKARIKTFEGLEKSIEEVSSKSELVMRRWRQIRIDNKITLVNNVQRQLQEEIEFVGKVALEEKARKTSDAANALLTKKKNRTANIVRELRAAEKDQRQTTRSSGRSRGRSTRGTGRSGTQESRYGGEYGADTGRSGRRGAGSRAGAAGDNEEQEQVDPEEQNEIDQWLQADVQDYDSKVTLFTAINEQIQTDFGSLRQISEQEQAKKTTAAIDGLLLARKLRYDELTRYIEEEKAKLEQHEEQTGRTREGQTDNMGQDDQTGGRRRRR